jgi:hypothetical protein
MKPPVYYETVTEAIKKLREKGFSEDFNLEENCIVCHPGRFSADQFNVIEIYRYEGDSDPADEATVYGIESTSGLKGILVTGYGAATDPVNDAILKKLTISR